MLVPMIGMSAAAQNCCDGNDCSAWCDDNSSSCGDGCCYRSGDFFGEFQYLRLKAFDTDGYNEGLGSDDGFRLIGGYQNCNGLGIRGRYFDFDGVQNVGGDEYGLDVSYFDVEVTQSFSLCKLDGVVSGGYRHAEHQVVYESDLDGDFDGDGVTLGIQLQRDINCNLGLYGWAQHSILVGDDAEESDDYIIGWTEVQLGTQYATCVGQYDVFARGGVEAQFHDGPAGGYEFGLLGWFLSAGVNF